MVMLLYELPPRSPNLYLKKKPRKLKAYGAKLTRSYHANNAIPTTAPTVVKPKPRLGLNETYRNKLYQTPEPIVTL